MPKDTNQGGIITRALTKLGNFFLHSDASNTVTEGNIFSRDFSERYIEPRADRQNMTPEDVQAIANYVQAVFPEEQRRQLGAAGTVTPLVPGTNSPYALGVLFQPNGEIAAFYKDKEKLPANVLACTPEQQQWMQSLAASMPGMGIPPSVEIGNAGPDLGRVLGDKGQIQYSENSPPRPIPPEADPRTPKNPADHPAVPLQEQLAALQMERLHQLPTLPQKPEAVAPAVGQPRTR
ncbi:hypothetical protein [Cupriavidus necator]